jgi:hypothetical protein
VHLLWPGNLEKKEKGWWQMTEKIKTICAWCGELIQDGKLIEGNPSHGVCPDCFNIAKDPINATLEELKAQTHRKIKNGLL